MNGNALSAYMLMIDKLTLRTLLLLNLNNSEKTPPPPLPLSFCSHGFRFRVTLLCVGDFFQKD